ncbi:MAG TPA: hypothetical protein VFN36_06145 [Solirubrobacteraceae bacterium]|nr:hypothetical protein [Solirubrobacteraceae bacterium]
MSALEQRDSSAAGPLTGRRAAALPPGLEAALAEIAAGAPARDAEPRPRFPADAIQALRRVGALGWNARPGRARPPAAAELTLVRRVAAADGSVGRIFDGHLNAVERLAVQAPAAVRDAELAAARAGTLLAGVWGGDPVRDEGAPARVRRSGSAEIVQGVKTFCSGAGGLDRAAVLAAGPDGGPPWLVWVDVGDRDHVEIDATWYRGRGLVASVSHRVVFHGAPVLARLGPPGAISEQPWLARDALRTAATWAGMADAATRAALAELARRPGRGDLESLAAGRILTARHTIDAWLEQAAQAMDEPDAHLGPLALHGRAAIAAGCRTLLDEAARACGSGPFARAETLDRARRDLELFLLQHRLDPLLAREGGRVLDQMATEHATGGGGACTIT